MIIAVYETAPSFPPTDQHATARRSRVGRWLVDHTGPEPLEAEVEALVKPTAQRRDDPLAALTERNRALEGKLNALIESISASVSNLSRG